MRNVLFHILASTLIVMAGCERGATRAFRMATQSNVRSFASALREFESDVGRYPTSEEGLSALETAPAGTMEKWDGPYAIGELENDAFGFRYIYRSPGTNGQPFTILSVGPDGKEGTSDDIAP